MAEDSVAASLHMHYMLAFYKGLFHKQLPGEDMEEQRMFISDNYAFTQMYQRLVLEVEREAERSHFQIICEQGHREYRGGNPCAYNVAKAMASASMLLTKNVSSKPEDWMWRNLHVRQYSNLPWSKTPLRFFFHREVPSGGNNNSLNVAGCKFSKNRQNTVFSSIHVAAYKMVVNFDAKDPRKDVNLYSIDTGMGGHPFQGHYFDMNSDHLYGRLRQMKIGQQLEGTKTNTLVLLPASAKKEEKKSNRRERKPRGGNKPSDFQVEDEL